MSTNSCSVLRFTVELIIMQHAVALIAVITAEFLGVSSAGGHALRKISRCELDDNGTHRGYIHFWFDAEEFIRLDLNSENWTAVNDKAASFINKWESARTEAQHLKNYLNKTCIGWLQLFVHYSTDTVKRKGTHTLQYDTAITPAISFTTGELDGEQFVSYNSNIKEVIPKTEWIKNAVRPDYWKGEKDWMWRELEDLQHLLNLAVEHFNHTKGEGSQRTHITVGVVVALLAVFVVMVIIWRWKKNSSKRTSVNSSTEENLDAHLNSSEDP